MRIEQTADGGFIAGGWSNGSIDGDKSEPGYGYFDYWIVRLNSAGQVIWDRTFGGNDSDQLAAVRETADGGFIVGGTSLLGPTGNQTVAGWGSFDFWILRLDSSGNRLWERALGGTGYESQLADVRPLADGGFVLVGESRSFASGNKSAPQPGAWVVRLDAAGEKLWDHSYDLTPYSLATTSDGGMFVGGINNWDYVVIRLDSHGEVLWQRVLAGNSMDFLTSVMQTDDGGCLLVGSSESGIGLDKTSPNFGHGDFWAVRLDASGNTLWDQTFGTAGHEGWPRLVAVPGGGFILGGYVLGDPSPFGMRDVWIVRIDEDGTALWDQYFGGVRNDELSSLDVTADGGFVLGAVSSSPASGNKTSPSLSPLFDFWIVKLSPASPGDCDGDGIPDSADLCPGTPVGLPVDANGCAVTQLDPDGDGVPLYEDWCPDTAPGAPVDEHGCSADQRDSDGDGISDSQDLCPNTAPGAVVDGSGCSIEQRCPCDGPWQNHGQYLQTVRQVTAEFLQAGLITAGEQRAFLNQAARSDCGKKSRR